MAGPEKPFLCSASGCGESFTNEDRLAVHARRHDMDLQLETKGVNFVADQTPTPTRFIRNCEEVGLFQDLQNVNPFEETFKRAMETRSGVSHHLNLDGNLLSTDDTLHTPHIFPHLPDDNSPATIYSNTERRTELTVNRQSSDEGSDQLNKSMSSSVEDNLTAVCLQDSTDKLANSIEKKMAALVGRKIFKRIEKGASKLKLIRQSSLDIEDINASTLAMNSDCHSEVREVRPCIDLSSDKNISNSNVKNSTRPLQIPVISISETPKGNMESDETSGKDLQVVLKKDLLIANTAKENNKLDIKATVKQNFSKLISQRSIDLALINFENESKNKTMDLNNISIEDIPDGIEDHSSLLVKDNCLENDNGIQHITERGLKRHNFKMTESKHVSISNNDDNSTHVFQQTSEIVNESNSGIVDSNSTVIPSVEMIGGKVLIESQENNANKGYELLLKWPDGKKVYLKEVFREEDAQNDMNKMSAGIPDANETAKDAVLVQNSNSSSVKRRLKEIIQSNAKQRLIVSSQTKPIEKNAPKIAINNIHARPKSVIGLPENYVILPQTIQSGVPTILRNNVQLLHSNLGDILAQDTNKQLNQNISVANSYFHSGGSDVYRTGLSSPHKVNLAQKSPNEQFKSNSSNILPSMTTDLTKSSNHDLSSLVNGNQPDFKVRKRKNDNAVMFSDINRNLNGTSDLISLDSVEKRNKKDTSKSSDAQERNRAAVLRYRARKEAMNKMVKAKNEVLEEENQVLNKKLAQALQEIQRLSDALASHANCSVTISKGTN